MIIAGLISWHEFCNKLRLKKLSSDGEVGMDDDGKLNIREEEIVFLWDGYNYIYVLSAPVGDLAESDSKGQLFS